MINSLRINESVAGVMKSLGVGKKPLVENDESKVATAQPAAKKKYGYISYFGDKKHETHAETRADAHNAALAHFKPSKSKKHMVHTHLAEVDDKPVIHTATESEEETAKKKRINLKVSTKSNHWHTGFNGTLEEAKKYYLGHTFDGKGADPVTSVVQISDVKEHSLSDDAPEVKNQPEGHDEEKEIAEDPTREKLETAKDEADERKGGAAELAADLRVSIRIEKMNIGRYKRMLAKHDLSEDGMNWLKAKIEDIEGAIEDMQDRLPGLEAEAAEGKDETEVKKEITESTKTKLRKAIVEIALG
jgi:hypothetical protein